MCVCIFFGHMVAISQWSNSLQFAVICYTLIDCKKVNRKLHVLCVRLLFRPTKTITSKILGLQYVEIFTVPEICFC